MGNKFNPFTGQIDFSDNKIKGATGTKATATDSDGNIVESTVTTTELQTLSGVSSDIQTQIDSKVPNSEKAAANGVATLDGAGKVPTSQLPNSVMEFQGNWNPSTNTPTLIDGTGNAGDVYRATATASVDLGSGSQSFVAGDTVTYSGSIWEKSPGSDLVQSVNSQQGVVVLDTDDVSDVAATNKYVTAAEKTQITTNQTNIGTNVTNIGTNTTDIGTNGTAIGLNTAKISADGSIDTHSDVDVSTNAPNARQVLDWDGSNFIPGTKDLKVRSNGGFLLEDNPTYIASAASVKTAIIEITATNWEGQSFPVAGTSSINQISLELTRFTDSPVGTIKATMYADSSGEPGSSIAVSDNVNATAITSTSSTSGDTIVFNFPSNPSLSAGDYHIIVDGIGLSTSGIYILSGSPGDPVAPGSRIRTTDAGSNWSVIAGNDVVHAISLIATGAKGLDFNSAMWLEYPGLTDADNTIPTFESPIILFPNEVAYVTPHSSTNPALLEVSTSSIDNVPLGAQVIAKKVNDGIEVGDTLIVSSAATKLRAVPNPNPKAELSYEDAPTNVFSSVNFAYNLLIFPTLVVDNKAEYNVVTGEYTILEDGWYTINLAVGATHSSALSDTQSVTLGVLVDAVDYKILNNTNGNGADTSLLTSGSYTGPFSAGEVITPYYRKNGTQTITAIAGPRFNYFNIVQIR